MVTNHLVSGGWVACPGGCFMGGCVSGGWVLGGWVLGGWVLGGCGLALNACFACTSMNLAQAADPFYLYINSLYIIFLKELFADY